MICSQSEFRELSEVRLSLVQRRGEEIDDVPRGHVYPCQTVLFGMVIDRASRACAVAASVRYVTVPVRMSILQQQGAGTRDPGRSNSDKRQAWRTATCGTRAQQAKLSIDVTGS